ncbi:hypothetical protein BDV96DRAFT_528794 [Lophiotrema nucula]|uniref:AAA+ ATPase domain-containing protein n=1 Tax=Lophiotrema nucula TaxID=690887 RepID=A0A6A5YV71_9PLEO|nr:hypothetical protein BDV96DRAFT_528794 [Lophiotrema nucula]
MSSQATDTSGTNDSTDNNPNSTHREIKQIATDTANEASSTPASTPQIVNTPSSASSVAAEEDPEVDAVIVAKKEMADKATKAPSGTAEARSSTEETRTPDVTEKKKEIKKKADKKGKGKKKVTKKSKKRKEDSSDDESSASEDDKSDSGSESDSESSSSDESSADEKDKRMKKNAKAIKKLLKEKVALKAALKAKSKKKSKKYDSSDSESSSDDSSSESDSDSESEVEKKRRKNKRSKRKRSKKDESSSDDSSSSEDEKETAKDKAKAAAEAAAKELVDAEEAKKKAAQIAAATEVATNMKAQVALLEAQIAANSATSTDAKKDDKKASKKGKLEFKRVDEVWDNKLRNWAIKTTSDEKNDEFDCVFAIRRKFDWEGKHHEYTLLDIKSKALRESLQEVLKDVKGVSLVEDNPSIDPHMMFLHHRELKMYIKELKTKLKKASRKSSKGAKKEAKKFTERVKHCKLLSAYLEEDYKDTRRKLRPMLKAGNITYDLLWALFKPNTIAFTPTYGVADDPRCFKVDCAYEQSSFFGDYYLIQGQYLEYDGKAFGMGDFDVKVHKFKGVKKITSLDTYPLEYVKKKEEVREKLVQRGKKFVTLQGMSYRQMKGLAFFKKKKGVGKVNINGRVMIDPAIFRRINPNYYISCMHKKQDDEDEEDDDDEEGGCGCEDEEEEEVDQQESADQTPEFKYKFYKNKKDGKWYVVRVPILDGGPDVTEEQLDELPDRKGKKNDPNESSFTEEDLLIASPVVLGFAFSEKLWLEFSLSGIADIQWNDTAFDSLVLPQTTKQNLRGLVSSHRFNAAKTIDDVIQGKGKGLNVVLHGPPGVGKTLTAESIAEYLKAPLYAVSAGELGTNSRAIEIELNRIMDITHSWGAILLLDEADVFLEQRAANDVHRNALVSVFLRLLEYYQGILFLTTNRVSTFDEAFQSRIHMGIRYENLASKARLEIWKSYIKKVRTKMQTEVPGKEGKEFKDSDLVELSKKNLNGRQIKNACITAQSIALAEKGEWGIEFVRRVLDVQEDFEQDLRGGTGYRDAMRQYT